MLFIMIALNEQGRRRSFFMTIQNIQAEVVVAEPERVYLPQMWRMKTEPMKMRLITKTATGSLSHHPAGLVRTHEERRRTL